MAWKMGGDDSEGKKKRGKRKKRERKKREGNCKERKGRNIGRKSYFLSFGASGALSQAIYLRILVALSPT